jgi:hypothetical protein
MPSFHGYAVVTYHAGPRAFVNVASRNHVIVPGTGELPFRAENGEALGKAGDGVFVLRSHLILQRSVLASKINDSAAKSLVGRVLHHANASTGSGRQGKRVVRSEQAIRKHGDVAEDKNKVRMRARGATRVVAALGVIKGRYVAVANKSDADRKEIKALLETKNKDVRIGAKIEKFVEDLNKSRRENRRQKERGVDKTYRVSCSSSSIQKDESKS